MAKCCNAPVQSKNNDHNRARPPPEDHQISVDRNAYTSASVYPTIHRGPNSTDVRVQDTCQFSTSPNGNLVMKKLSGWHDSNNS